MPMFSSLSRWFRRCPWLAVLVVLTAFSIVATPTAAQDSAATTDEAYLARIAFSSGRNLVKKVDGRFVRVETDTKLVEGDVVRVSSQGRVTIVFNPSGIYQTIGAGEEYTVTMQAQAAVQAADPGRANEAMIDSLRQRDQATFAAVGGTRERRDPGQPFPLYPRNTLLLPATQVELIWEAPDGQNPGYIVVIFCEGRQIGRFETREPRLVVTADRVAFEPSRLYYWYVMRADRPRVPAVKPMFKIMSDSVRAELMAQFDTIRVRAKVADEAMLKFSYAAVLANEMVFADALQNLRDLYALSPGDTGLLRAIRNAYRQMGFFPEDIDRFVRELRRQHPEFLGARNLQTTLRADGITVSWTPTDHLDATAYLVEWWKADEPEPAVGAAASSQRAELSVQPSLDLPLPAGTYRIRVRTVGADGPLKFDAGESAPIEVQIR